MNYYITNHNNKTQDKLRDLHSKQPKAFWKLINKLDNKNVDDKINIEELYNYFKNLNTGEVNDEPDPFINLSDHNLTLNSPITQTEIKKCVNNLQYNKSPAVDKITNEFLKSTVDIMLPLYTDYFNVILEIGIIPDAWLQGNSSHLQTFWRRLKPGKL